jgi:hypothetical protein
LDEIAAEAEAMERAEAARQSLEDEDVDWHDIASPM